jgi:flagellar basal-body rod modification protein FlgD
MTTTTSTSTQSAAQTSASTAQTTKTQAARTKIGETYDNFLTLLTTQLKNQDPMSPMDSSQFTNQLVQFSQVEQQISQSEKMDKLISLQGNNQTQASLGFIGMDVEVTGKNFTLGDDPVKMSYTLPSASTSTKVQIKDSKGNTIQTIDGARLAGRKEVTWDGKKADGTKAAAGDYSVVVVAPDASGKYLTVPTTVFGRVSGIEAGNGNTSLLMGNVPVQMENVKSAHLPTSTAA